MNAGREIRAARIGAGLSQKELADLAGTSQPAVAMYEAGKREPGLSTFERLLAAAGARLRVETGHAQIKTSSRADLERSNRKLMEVLELAALLPTTHSETLYFPRLTEQRSG